MHKGLVLVCNDKQKNIIDCLVKNLPTGLIGCWGVLYESKLVTQHELENFKKDKSKSYDCTFYQFIKGWYGDIENSTYA
jgi:hypothetical protein